MPMSPVMGMGLGIGTALLLLAALALPSACAARLADEPGDGPRFVLVTDSRGFVHDVVRPPGGDSIVSTTLDALVKRQFNGTLVHVGDASRLDEQLLDPDATAAVIFYTTGDIPLDVPLLKSYLENGGGMLGIHCATDTLKDDAQWAGLIGGIFDGHPWNADAQVTLKGHDREHAAARPIRRSRTIREEIYQFRDFDPERVRVLVSLDMEQTPLKRPHHVPVVWCREVGEGRLLYTSLGHREDVWRSDWYQQHLTGALMWLMDMAPGSAEPNPEVHRRETALAREAYEQRRRPDPPPAPPGDAPPPAPGLGPTATAPGVDDALFHGQPVSVDDPSPARPHDPWVFRCVLDGRPRVIVVALHEDLWVAYDAATCGLYKAWTGGINFTGSVYDDRHGPQPRTLGTTLEQLLPDADDAEAGLWELRRGDDVERPRLRFLGYSRDGESSVTFRWELPATAGRDGAVIEETPGVETDGDEVVFVRHFRVRGLPEGQELRVQLGAAPGARHDIEGADVVTQETGTGTTTWLVLENGVDAQVRTTYRDPG